MEHKNIYKKLKNFCPVQAEEIKIYKILKNGILDANKNNFYYYWVPRKAPYDHCQSMWRPENKMSNKKVDIKSEKDTWFSH